ncbi:MAG: hypothetical protein RDV41_09885 [Planctomycetota bacterium]|nr:hypothetical protein [Planctomycetota bacterium]
MTISRRTKVFIVVGAIVFIVPFVFLSGWFLEMMQSRIDKNFEKTNDPSAGTQYMIARIYDITLREKPAAAAYEKYLVRFRPETPEQVEEYVEVKFLYATVLETCHKYEEAKAEYGDIANNYPEHPRAELANQAWKRLTMGAVGPGR